MGACRAGRAQAHPASSCVVGASPRGSPDRHARSAGRLSRGHPLGDRHQRANPVAGGALAVVAPRRALDVGRAGDVQVGPGHVRPGRTRAGTPPRSSSRRCARRRWRGRRRASPGTGAAPRGSASATTARRRPRRQRATSSRQPSSLPMTPAIREPRATIWAPVRVATSTIASGSSAPQRTRASIITRRPSASVFRTSTVRAAVGGDHVAGPLSGAAGHVLRDRQVGGHPRGSRGPRSRGPPPAPPRPRPCPLHRDHRRRRGRG